MAVPPGLVLDLTRLFRSVLRPKPRGIDRVEMLYARWLLARWPSEAYSVLSSNFGARVFKREQALAACDLLETIWGERPRSGLLADLWRMGLLIGFSARRRAPQGAIYLNVGHLTLSTPRALDWVRARPDLTPVFMLHDLIPVDHPKFVNDREAAYFNRILETLSLAEGLILNTSAVAQHPRLAGLRARKIVAHLPLSPAFLEPPSPSGEPQPYVLAYGEIEPRKNLAVLTEAWRRLGADSAAPRLLIAGGAGDGMSRLNRALDAWDPQRRRVEIRHDLSTERLRDLIAGAQAVFAPSFAEGFGLAVAEALTLGTPVVASDIPAHREVGAGRAQYLAPDDVAAWADAALALVDPAHLAGLRAKAASGEPSATPERYFDQISQALMELALTRRGTSLNGSAI